MQLLASTRHHRLRLALAFFAIYVIWGSTYLAIRYAVEDIPRSQPLASGTSSPERFCSGGLE